MAVELTTDQYNSLIRRIRLLEQRYNGFVEALNQAMTVETYTDLSSQIQVVLAGYDTRVQELEARVEAIEDQPL